MATLTVITAPTTEPVTLTEVKSALGVTYSDDDVELTDLIQSAREYIELYTGRRLMTQVLELSFDRWPSVEFPIGEWPLQSIDSVKYDDASSPVTEQTLTVNTDYYADTTTEKGRVRAITSWPSVANQPNAIRVRFTAGYDSADAVPAAIKRGIILWVGGLYQCPDYIESAKMVLRPYRIL